MTREQLLAELGKPWGAAAGYLSNALEPINWPNYAAAGVLDQLLNYDERGDVMHAVPQAFEERRTLSDALGAALARTGSPDLQDIGRNAGTLGDMAVPGPGEFAPLLGAVLPLTAARRWHRASQLEDPLERVFAGKREMSRLAMGAADRQGLRARQQAKRPYVPTPQRLDELVRGGQTVPYAENWYDLPHELLTRVAPGLEDFFLKAFAATSVRATPKENFRRTRNALAAMRENPKAPRFSGMMPTVQKNLERAARGEEIRGPKTNPYIRAHRGDKQAVVVDTWMLRIYGMTDDATDAEKLWVEKRIRDDAQRAGFGDRPRDFQALLWFGIKNEIDTVKGAEPLRHWIEQGAFNAPAEATTTAASPRAGRARKK